MKNIREKGLQKRYKKKNGTTQEKEWKEKKDEAKEI